MAVLFDDKSAAEEFRDWAKERAVEGSINLCALGPKHWIVAAKTYDLATEGNYPSEIEDRLDRMQAPIVGGHEYAYSWDAEEDLLPVMNLVNGSETKPILEDITKEFGDQMQRRRG